MAGLQLELEKLVSARLHDWLDEQNANRRQISWETDENRVVVRALDGADVVARVEFHKL